MMLTYALILLGFTFITSVSYSDENCYRYESGCCPGYERNRETGNCTECKIGYSGLNCSKQCLYPSFGWKCKLECDCSKENCNFSTGCLVKSFFASLLHYLHQLKSENYRLEGHIKSLATRRDHLLAVNARLSIPFSSPLHPDSFLYSDKPTDGKTVEPSLMQNVACLTADNPVQAGGSTTVPAVTRVSSLPPMTSVLNLSVSNTLSAMDSTPTSMEVTLPSSSTPDKSKPDVT
ncbi:zinc finger protein zfp-1-like isoform X1 [Crassostrea angulata]|uniref:zinc finger protein zfp-1-like isoform X1 n=1 Tax=Magallana angulata TaxID=2784310 RepID=UPI0022B1F60C|nr:zinc finger protein zfp-1-like isoform X1 [Crassostrea angulata]